RLLLLLILRISFVTHCHRFFYPVTATTVFYTLSLHDALPICAGRLGGGTGGGRAARSNGVAGRGAEGATGAGSAARWPFGAGIRDRKSTRLNSSHVKISYAVFCLKKKKNNKSPYKRNEQLGS